MWHHSYIEAYHEPSIPYICRIGPGNFENHLWSLIHEGLYWDFIILLPETRLTQIAQDWNT